MKDYIQVTIPNVKMKIELSKNIDKCYIMIHITFI